MMTHEVLRFMRLKKNEEYHMTIKIDMNKVYDRVKWKYLEKLLEKMEFNKKWIGWIIGCVTSVNYMILVNGSLGNKMTPTRGIRQGDPISQYLFILCMEGLSLSLRRMEYEGNIEGIKIERNSSPISHLLFIDDCYIFTKIKIKYAKNLRKFLAKFS